MTRKPSNKRTQQLSGVQIMFAAILAIGLMLAINFSTRIANSRLQRETYANIEAEVEALQQEQATLVAELDYVQSDTFVERWARSEGKMVRPGEILVIPVPLNTTPLATPTPSVVVEVDTSPPEPDNWTLWWALFFDSPPPDF